MTNAAVIRCPRCDRTGEVDHGHVRGLFRKARMAVDAGEPRQVLECRRCKVWLLLPREVVAA